MQQKFRKLSDCGTLKEAIKLLDAKKVTNPSLRKLVGLAYKMTHDEDKKNTLEDADKDLNKEMEDQAMGKDKSYSDRGPAKNADKQKQNSEARPDSGEDSKLHGNPSGDPGSDVPTPSAPGGDGDAEKTADEQTGKSQLGGNGENMMQNPYEVQQPGQDMMNQKIIELMDPTQGNMSKVSAENMAGQDMRGQMGFLQEAMNPTLKKIHADVMRVTLENTALKEAIKIIQDGKDNSKIQLFRTGGPGGNKETINNPGDDPTVNSQAQEIQKISEDSIASEELGKDILLTYCS